MHSVTLLQSSCYLKLFSAGVAKATFGVMASLIKGGCGFMKPCKHCLNNCMQLLKCL